MSAGARDQRFTRVAADGSQGSIDRAVAQEVPVAVEIGGIGYAVLMATPVDLVDLAYGFALSERLIDQAADVLDVDVHVGTAGTLLRITVATRVAGRVQDRVRHRTADSSCGLCGIESLEQTMRPLPRVPPWAGDPMTVFAALADLRTHQALNAATGAVHAAARCAGDGTILEVREDVGRHNAFDKLIGAMLRSGEHWHDGFALLSSRCSYELVEKAALARCPMLATMSAPTALALERAGQAGLTLIALARADSLLVARP